MTYGNRSNRIESNESNLPNLGIGLVHAFYLKINISRTTYPEAVMIKIVSSGFILISIILSIKIKIKFESRLC